MDVFAEQVGEVTDEHYLKQNCGKSKNIPADLPVSFRELKFLVWLDGAQKDP